MRCCCTSFLFDGCVKPNRTLIAALILSNVRSKREFRLHWMVVAMVYLRGSKLNPTTSATKRSKSTPNLPENIPPWHVPLPKKYNKLIDIKTPIRHMLSNYVTMEVYKYLCFITCHPVTLHWGEECAAIDASIE